MATVSGGDFGGTVLLGGEGHRERGMNEFFHFLYCAPEFVHDFFIILGLV